MKDFVTSSALTRLLANLFIFLCLVVALFVAAYEVVQGQQVNPLAYSIISGGLTYAATILGAHLSIQSMPDTGLSAAESPRVRETP